MTVELSQMIRTLCLSAKAAAPAVAKAPSSLRNAALNAMADAILRNSDVILSANAEDLRAARERGLSEAMCDRLQLTRDRIEKMAQSVREISLMDDPIGQMEHVYTRPNGLKVGKMRIPLGVVAIIYEARPNVTSDAAALCLKSGNVVILKGGSEAFRSNLAIIGAIKSALSSVQLPEDCVSFVESTDRAAVDLLIRQTGLIDLLIPRGGESLIRHVSENATVPVIQHYKGVCHIFVEKTARMDQVLPILLNAKCQRPGVCNAMETLLLDQSLEPNKIQEIIDCLVKNGVCLHVSDDLFQKYGNNENIKPAVEEDWPREYLSLDLAVKTVDGIDAAIAHIQKYSSQHTEAILTSDYFKAEQFVAEVQSSTVLVNASTRFADGGELGLGAEIGISTSKLHAYGPMGARELTTTKFVVHGNGQIRK